MNNQTWTGFTAVALTSLFVPQIGAQATTMKTPATQANPNQQQKLNYQVITPLLVTELKTEVAIPDSSSVIFNNQAVDLNPIPVLKFVPAESLVVKNTPQQLIANAAPSIQIIGAASLGNISKNKSFNKSFKTANNQVAPKVSDVNNDSANPVNNSVANPPEEKVLFSQVGKASYYGFEGGSKTASGERYNPSGLSAAHRTLPFGSKVRVTNLRTGKSVVVRINDRGPFIRGRIVDLSSGAAGKIGLKSQGVGNVKLEVLSYGSGNRSAKVRKVRTRG